MGGWLQAMLLTAFTAGLLGGVHCAAMCGGIVSLTCITDSDGGVQRRGFPLAYNAGRIASYAVAGALVGLLSVLGVNFVGGR